MANGKKPTAPLHVIPGGQDPNNQGEDHFEFDMDNLSEFARESLEKEKLVETTREEVKEDLSGTGQKLKEIGEYFEQALQLGDTEIAISIATPGDAQLSLKEIREYFELNPQYIPEEEERKKLSVLLSEIYTKHFGDSNVAAAVASIKAIIEDREKTGAQEEAVPIPLIPKKKEPVKEEPAKKEPIKASQEAKPEPATPPAKEEKKSGKKKLEVKLAGESFEAPNRDAGRVKKVLKKIRTKLEEAEITDDEKDALLKFLQEVGKVYETNTELDDVFSQIEEVLNRPKAAEEPKTAEPDATELKGYLNLSVEALEITARGRVALQNLNIKHVSELVQKTEEELLKNLGYVALREIKKALSNMGLSLGMKLEGYAPAAPVTPPAPPAPPAPPVAAKSEPPVVETAKPASPAPVEPPPVPQPPTPTPTATPAPASTPAPTPTPTPASTPAPAAEPAKDVKKDAKIEDINEVMKRLYETIKNDPEFKELIRLMNLLKVDPKTITDDGEWRNYLKAMVSTFGTERIQDVLKTLRDGNNGPLKDFVQPGSFTRNYEIDPQDAVRKLLTGLSGVDDTERLKVMRQRTHTLVEDIQALKISASKSAPLPAPAPTTPAPATPAAPAAAPTPAPTTTPAPAPKPLTPQEAELEVLRTKYKDDSDMLEVIDIAVAKKGLEQGIRAARVFEKMREEDEAKKTKAGTAAPAAGTPAPAPTPAPTPTPAPASTPTPAPAPAPKTSPEKIAIPASLEQAIEEASAGNSKLKERFMDLWKVAQKKAKSNEMTDIIEKMMGQALHLSKKPGKMAFAVSVLNDLLDKTITADIAPLSGEAVDLGRLRQLMEDLAEDEPDLQEFKALLNDLSKILEADPAGYPKSAILESIQNEIRKILPQALGAKSIHELLGKFDPKIGYLDQLDALQRLSDELKKNGKLPAMIERAKKIIGSKGPGGGTPPAPPATPPAGGASGARSAASPRASAAGPATSSASASAPSASAPVTGPAPAPAPVAPPVSASSVASAPAPSASAPASSPSMHAGPLAPDFPSESERWTAIIGFISGVGLDPDSKEPAMVALKGVLSYHIDTPARLADLEQYIGTLDFRGRSLEDLETEKERKEDERDTLQRRIIDLEQQRKKIKPTSPDRDAIEQELKKLGTEKLTLISQIKTLGKGIKRKANETGKEIQLDNPEQLLGAVNMYFATQKAKGKAPDFKVVLAHTLKQIEAAKNSKKSRGGAIFDKIYKWGNPLNYLKPRLSSTLVLIAEKDDALKGVVTPEKAAKLAEIYDKPDSVARWVKELGGKEKYAENMEKVVPALISHLTAAVNNGRMANINSFSLENARTLLNILRDIVHNYAIDHAKTQKGGDVEKMSAYFEKLNGMNKDSKERENFVMWNSMKQSWIKAGGIAAGVAGGVGALAVASLSAPVIVGASVAGIGAPLIYSSFRVTDPKTKEILRKTASRFIATGALGGLALAATPWLLPLAIPGLFAPEVWKNRKQIATTTAKYAPPVAKGTGKVVYHTARVGTRLAWAGMGAWVSLFGLGLPLFNQRFRNFFGIHFRPLIGK